MYCSSCGTAISPNLKYCNRCGARLTRANEDDIVKSAEKRLYDESVDLFWVTVIGLGLILGGIVVMKTLGLSNWLIAGYMILGSTAFTINVGLSLWQIRRFAKLTGETQRDQIDGSLKERATMADAPRQEALPSVTEHTTRSLDPVLTEKAK